MKLRNLLFCLLVLMISSPCHSSEKQSRLNKVERGKGLVEKFYHCLSQNAKDLSCDKIFLDDGVSSYDARRKWKYLLSHRQLFYKDHDSIQDKGYFNKARKSYAFFNPPATEKVLDGYLYVTVVTTLPKHFYSGMYKEVSFPVEEDESSGGLKINFSGIKINGVLLNVEKEFDHDFNLMEGLGFVKE